MNTATERRELLKGVYTAGRECVACPLHETRTQVVFGSGNADAALMFIGEAPGANEDLQGVPFVGQAGKLLERLLGEIGMERGDVFIANTLMCRPPGNRDPYPHELDACRHWLFSKLDLIQPTMVCTLGNFATKLLRGDPTGISKVHGEVEITTIGPRAVRLYPLYHPAAALYTPSTLEMLRTDFARIPEILALGPPEQPEPELDVELQSDVTAPVEPAPEASQAEPVGLETADDQTPAQSAPEPPDAEQLGLF